MIDQASVGIGGELGDQGGLVAGSDRGRRTGGMAGGEIARRAPLTHVAFDGAQADREAAGDCGLAQAIVDDGADDALAQIPGICSHHSSEPPRQSFCNPL
jgi:hypothetical protein